MDINEFLQKSEGKWFSQRTYYDLTQQTSQDSKSEITIELLPATDAAVARLCQQAGFNPEDSCGGARIGWDNSVDWDAPAQRGQTVVAAVPSPQQPQTGQLVQQPSGDGQTPLVACYEIAADESLTLTAEAGETYSQERLWFAHPNLRLRTVLQGSQSVSRTAFYSEIGRVSAQ